MTENKKAIILEYQKARGIQRAERGNQRAATCERLGNGASAPAAYSGQVQREAGTRASFNGRYGASMMEEPYAGRLRGLLRFSDLESAEKSIRELDDAYRDYRAGSDRAGTAWVRQLAVKGKLRAASLAANPRVCPEKRREKSEIAQWFRVWLEVPDLFFDWLELRKQSEEYQEIFQTRNGPREQE